MRSYKDSSGINNRAAYLRRKAVNLVFDRPHPVRAKRFELVGCIVVVVLSVLSFLLMIEV